MLRLALTLHNARTGCAESLGILTITNDATGDSEYGQYAIHLTTAAGTVRTARVEDYPRHLGAWHLVYCALEALEGPP